MQIISSHVNKIIRKIFGQKHPLLAEIVINWPKIIGLKFSSKTNPIKIVSTKEKGQSLNILVVQIENASLSTEIHFQQDIIIERLAVYLGFKAIHKLRLIIQ